MADFSPSGVASLPQLTAESLQHGDTRVLGWLREWVAEGDAINRADPSYDLIGRAHLPPARQAELKNQAASLLQDLEAARVASRVDGATEGCSSSTRACRRTSR